MAPSAHSFEENLTEALTHLQRFATEPLPHLIGGSPRLSVSGETFVNHSPIDQSVLGDVASGDTADIAAAADAAAQAFGPWQALGGEKRRQILNDVATLITDRARQIALVECVDTGQTIRFMGAAAIRGAANFRYFADLAPSVSNGQSLPTETHINYTTRRALGPVGVITPWNTPFMLSTWKIAPALAAGCTVVHKPAEWSPYTAHLLAEIGLEAGLPPGVLNVVHGLGHTAGKSLTEHPAIKAIAFVGESSTGSAIQAQGAPTLKRVHFELGGKNPVIVFDDADLDRALDAVTFMIYSLNGERCTSSSRVLIQDSIYQEFTDRIAARIKDIPVGHPLEPDAVIGPLVHPRHTQKVRSYIDAAKISGATVHYGTDMVDRPSENFVPPMLFTAATNDMPIAQEEIFGPALTAIPFSDEDDAVRMANDIPYGLAGYLWTNDVARAHRVSDTLDCGMVWVNSQNVRHLPTPFGGVKASGIGRDGGDWSFDFYTETKNISVALGHHPIPNLAG